MVDIKARGEKLLADYPVWLRWTIPNFFDQIAENSADKPFILTEDRAYTYAETRRIAETLARGYLQMGVKPRDHVALLMGNLPEFVFNLLALLKIGAVTITINTQLRERELEFILRDSDAVLLVANDKLG